MQLAKGLFSVGLGVIYSWFKFISVWLRVCVGYGLFLPSFLHQKIALLSLLGLQGDVSSSLVCCLTCHCAPGLVLLVHGVSMPSRTARLCALLQKTAPKLPQAISIATNLHTPLTDTGRK